MENNELDDMPLLDTITEELEWTTRVNQTAEWLANRGATGNGDCQQLQMDVFDLMISLVHGARTLHEQIIHLHGMAQWLHDEADRFHALGMGTVLMRSSDRLQ